MSNQAPRTLRASHMFYDSWRELCASAISARTIPKLNQTRRFRRLPNWVWTVLSYSLSLQRQYHHPKRVGTFLYVFTMASCITFAISGSYFLVYDVISKRTRSTVFTGTVNSILGLSWVSIASYANYLGHSVFRNACLHKKVRLHTKSLFRVNTAILLLIVALAGMALNNYLNWSFMEGTPCTKVGLSAFVCQIRYVSGIVYGLILVYWNIIVGWSLMSICRTHTIGCRRFVQELEFEGRVMEKLYNLKLAAEASESVPVADLRAWEDSELTTANVQPSDFMEHLDDSESQPADHQRHTNRQLSTVPPPDPSSPPQDVYSIQEDSPDPPAQPADISLRCSAARTSIFRNLESQGVRDAEAYEKLLLSADDVCIRLWKIGKSLRITSIVFQRWMATWLAFTGLWALTYIVYWIKHKATFFELMDFFVPVFLVVLLCAGFAEVNLECSRIVKSMYPRVDRLNVNRFVTAEPPVITVYNTGVTYQVIGGFVLAFIVAFTSRIVMDEFGKI